MLKTRQFTLKSILFLTSIAAVGASIYIWDDNAHKKAWMYAKKNELVICIKGKSFDIQEQQSGLKRIQQIAAKQLKFIGDCCARRNGVEFRRIEFVGEPGPIEKVIAEIRANEVYSSSDFEIFLSSSKEIVQLNKP